MRGRRTIRSLLEGADGAPQRFAMPITIMQDVHPSSAEANRRGWDCNFRSTYAL
jgi:hypothetical protein